MSDNMPRAPHDFSVREREAYLSRGTEELGAALSGLISAANNIKDGAYGDTIHVSESDYRQLLDALTKAKAIREVFFRNSGVARFR